MTLSREESGFRKFQLEQRVDVPGSTELPQAGILRVPGVVVGAGFSASRSIPDFGQVFQCRGVNIIVTCGSQYYYHFLVTFPFMMFTLAMSILAMGYNYKYKVKVVAD